MRSGPRWNACSPRSLAVTPLVEVNDGVVTLNGFDTGQETDLAGLLARTVPGVVEVRVTAAS
jgi:osmotically-inducible protein OsmY